MTKYAEEYQHKSWIVRFKGHEHDGLWDDSSEVEYHFEDSVYNQPFMGSRQFKTKDEAIVSAMTKIRNWIDKHGQSRLTTLRQTATHMDSMTDICRRFQEQHDEKPSGDQLRIFFKEHREEFGMPDIGDQVDGWDWDWIARRACP